MWPSSGRSADSVRLARADGFNGQMRGFRDAPDQEEQAAIERKLAKLRAKKRQPNSTPAQPTDTSKSRKKDRKKKAVQPAQPTPAVATQPQTDFFADFPTSQPATTNTDPFATQSRQAFGAQFEPQFPQQTQNAPAASGGDFFSDSGWGSNDAFSAAPTQITHQTSTGRSMPVVPLSTTAPASTMAAQPDFFASNNDQGWNLPGAAQGLGDPNQLFGFDQPQSNDPTPSSQPEPDETAEEPTQESEPQKSSFWDGVGVGNLVDVDSLAKPKDTSFYTITDRNALDTIKSSSKSVGPTMAQLAQQNGPIPQSSPDPFGFAQQPQQQQQQQPNPYGMGNNMGGMGMGQGMGQGMGMGMGAPYGGGMYAGMPNPMMPRQPSGGASNQFGFGVPNQQGSW